MFLVCGPAGEASLQLVLVCCVCKKSNLKFLYVKCVSQCSTVGPWRRWLPPILAQQKKKQRKRVYWYITTNMFIYVNTGLPAMLTWPFYMPPISKSGLKGRGVDVPITHPPTSSTVVYAVLGSVGSQFEFLPVLCNRRSTCASGQFHAGAHSCTPFGTASRLHKTIK